MYRHDFAIYCKSFRDDFDRLQVLLDSLTLNGNQTPLLLSVPAADVECLNRKITLPDFVELVMDESYVMPGPSFSYGWLQQQICKLSVHRTEFAKSYAVIDSDTYFIRGVGLLREACAARCIIASNIFTKYLPGNVDLVKYMLDETFSPPTINALACREGADERLRDVISKSDELARLPPDRRGHLINQIFDVPNLALQPSQYFHSDILIKFEEYLDDLGLTFYDCIRLSPWEYNWYACFSLAKLSHDVIGVCSSVLHFASESDVAHAKLNGINLEVIRRRFSAIQMAARHFDRQTLDG